FGDFAVRYHWGTGCRFLGGSGGSYVPAGTTPSPSLAGRRRRPPSGRPGLPGALDAVPAALLAVVLPQGTARLGHAPHPTPPQRPGAKDVRADRPPGRPAPQAGAALRRRRRLG